MQEAVRPDGIDIRLLFCSEMIGDEVRHRSWRADVVSVT